MPAVTHAELASEEPSSTYHISASHICAGLTGLSILSLLIVFLHVVFWSKSSKAEINKSRQQGQVRDRLGYLVSQQQLHHHFFHDQVWAMTERSRGVSSNAMTEQDTFSRKSSPDAAVTAENEKIAEGGDENEPSEHVQSTGNMFGPGKLSELRRTRFELSRPPPPPPLTAPELSPSVFTYDDRRRSFTGTAPELDASFFEQPNPDYMSSIEKEMGTTTGTQTSQATRSSPTTRRRSYTKTMSIGVPTPTTGPEHDEANVAFSPSSYPPASPILPGPPPIHGEILEDGTFRKIQVQGEIISRFDDSGAGWKRHTRVYGGGVCLACAASGDDDDHGGFYGENVLPEEKRY